MYFYWKCRRKRKDEQNVGNEKKVAIWWMVDVKRNSAKEKRSSVAPTGNRTQGKCLEGIYVTTTPLVLLLCDVSHSCVMYCCARNLHVFILFSSPFHHSFSTPFHHLSLTYTMLTTITVEINHTIYQDMSMSFLITQ